MSVDSSTAIGRRKTRDDWIAAARKVLVKSGVDNVKVDRLASDLQTTRGSFYWHFVDREDLLDALLHDWEAVNYQAIAAIRARWARSTPDLTELIEWWVSEGSEWPAFGMAIRTWARAEADVEQVMHRVDNEWINLVQLLFAPESYDESERLVRSRVLYFHQIGYHALALREKQSERLRLIPYYYKVLTGHEPGDSLRNLMRSFEQNQTKSASSAQPSFPKPERHRGISRTGAHAVPRSSKKR